MRPIYIFLLTLITLLPGTASAQSDSTAVFDTDHPLVYEDAWDLWPYTFLN